MGSFFVIKGRMKFQKAKEIYEKCLALENIDPTLVSRGAGKVQW